MSLSCLLLPLLLLFFLAFFVRSVSLMLLLLFLLTLLLLSSVGVFTPLLSVQRRAGEARPGEFTQHPQH